MHLTSTSIRAWAIVLWSAILLLIASVWKSNPKPDTKRLVFYSATTRPTVETLIEALADIPNLPIEIFSATYGQPRVNTHFSHTAPKCINISTWRGAKALANADLVICADRPRSLVILAITRRTRLIDVWHGISFKPIRRPGFLRWYEEIWVSSPYVAKLYEQNFGIAADRLKVLGHTPAEKLSPISPSPDTDFRPAESAGNYILLAPTWHRSRVGPECSNIPFWFKEDLLLRLADRLKATFLVRSHHLSALPTFSEGSSGQIKLVPQEMYPDPTPFLQYAKALITDWSSLAFDFLATGRPTVFVEAPCATLDRYLISPSERWGNIAKTAKEFETHLLNMFAIDSYEERASDRRRMVALQKFLPMQSKGVSASSLQVTRIMEVLGIPLESDARNVHRG